MPPEQIELIGEEGYVQKRDDRLWRAVGQGSQPRPLTARQDDGGYWAPVQGSASLMSMTGMPSRMG